MGAILTLFIVILGMGAIMLWGAPAIQGLQEHAQFQSTLTQMVQINGEIRHLRDPQSARVGTLAVNAGTLSVTPGSRWMVAAYADSAFVSMNVSKWESDASTVLQISGLPAGDVNLTVDRADGGTFTTMAQCDGGACNTNVSLATYFIPANVTRVQVRQNALIKAEAWIFEAGRVSYAMGPRDDSNRVHLEMGGVFVQQRTFIYLEENPTLKDPAWALVPKDTAYFFRALQVTGNASTAGQGRFPLTITLQDNYGYTRGRPLFDNASAVRVQVDDSAHTALDQPGLLEEAFCNYFSQRGNVTRQGTACSGGNVNLLYNPDDVGYTNGGRFTFEFNQAVVKVVVRA